MSKLGYTFCSLMLALIFLVSVEVKNQKWKYCSAKNKYISYMLSGARLQLDWLNKPGNIARAHIKCWWIFCCPILRVPPQRPPSCYCASGARAALDSGGRPRLAGSAGMMAALPRCGFRRSMETVSLLPPNWISKCFSPLRRTANGPSYRGESGGLCPSRLTYTCLAANSAAGTLAVTWA